MDDNHEIQFHLGVLMIDLRALDMLKGTSSVSEWTTDVSPVVAHARAVCTSFAHAVEPDIAVAINDLSHAIGEMRPEPPREDAHARPSPSWVRVREAHRQVLAHLHSARLENWVLSDP